MNDTTLKKTITWWEKKRLFFNIIIGIIGAASVATFIPHTFNLEDAIGIVLWGIMANVLYSSGILLEIANQYYLKGKLNIFQFRHFFFIAGMLPYMFITWIYTSYYYEVLVYIP